MMAQEEAQTPRQLIDVVTAAHYLNVSKRTLYALVTDNKVPHVRVGGSIRFVPDVLERWVSNGGDHE